MTDEQIRLRSTDMPEDEELVRLRRRLDRHLDEYRLHILEEERREERLQAALESNTKSIGELALATKGLVDVWNTASGLQRFVKWVTGFSGIALFVAWYNDLFKIGS